MSVDLKGKKRKSVENIATAPKKVKTTSAEVEKSADRPEPLKSALKKGKSKTGTPKVEKVKKSKKSKTIVSAPNPVEPTAVIVDEEEAENIISAAAADDGEGPTELTPDQTDALLAGFSSDEESDGDGNAEEGIEISELPSAPTTAKALQIASKAKGTKEDDEATPGVIYISRLPHGFFEPQLRAYLSQFGTITNVRLARNRKTGKSKHYAFIEFGAASVADIVAKTMDKYLLFSHILQCKRVPQEQVKEGMWIGLRGPRVRPRNRLEGTKLRKGSDREGWGKRVTREQQRREEKAAKLKELGYEFEMPELKTVENVPKQEKSQSAVKVGSNVDEETPIVEETVTVAVEAGSDAKAVVTLKTTKRKSKTGAGPTTSTTITKKRKTKAV